jgi:hypothetical protein
MTECPSRPPADTGRSSRISVIDITGMNRANRANKNVKNPSVPANVSKSQNVGVYRPQLEGF